MRRMGEEKGVQRRSGKKIDLELGRLVLAQQVPHVLVVDLQVGDPHLIST
jgi:hypothetical protein